MEQMTVRGLKQSIENFIENGLDLDSLIWVKFDEDRDYDCDIPIYQVERVNRGTFYVHANMDDGM